jgi:regulatory protein YycH of two-component signal transduction system YycFG
MIERIKSGILFLLVGLSLFMTYQLWYGQKPAQLIAEDVYERIIVEKPRPLDTVVTPAYILLAAAEEGYYLLREGDSDYAALWNNISILLQEYGKENLEVESGDLAMEGARRILTAYLKPALPVGLDLPWLSDAMYAAIGWVDFYSLEGERWLILSSPDREPKLSIPLIPEKAEAIEEIIAELNAEKVLHLSLDTDRLSGLVSRDLEVKNDIYVPGGAVFMERLQLKPEEIDRDLLLKTFFIDYNLARIIEERDGGIIYTDGERGLRLSNVSFEYSSPRLEEGQATALYPDALNNCSSLISYHGGWPEGLRLEELALSGWGGRASYSAEWRMYFLGYPLLSNNSARAVFNDRGLIHFSRSLYFPVELPEESQNDVVETAGWTEALQAAVAVFEARYPDDTESVLSLESMSLAYAVIDSDPAATVWAEPVWVIKINGEKFILRAGNLSPAESEDLL